MASSLQSVHLFEGVGGFSLAAQRSGIAPALLCENDKYKQRILRRHFPHLPLISDVHDLNRDHLADIDPTRAVATGGFPCTDLSVAGRRAGLAGTKSGLFWQIVRILGEWPAAWFVLENVQAFCHRTADGTWESPSPRWLNSGIASPGECWMLSTSDWPSDANVSFLSAILEAQPIPPKYF